MARQEAACWRCGAQWASEDVPAPTLRVIAGGQLARRAAETAQADARLEADRWLNDGGSVASEAAGGPLPAAALR